MFVVLRITITFFNYKKREGIKMKSKMDKKFAFWKNIPRKEISWHPVINEDKCGGCGMCVTSCGRDVFGFYKEKNIAVVARPMQCLVGCTSCESWCVFDAIGFPDRQYVKDLIKKKRLLVVAKKQLKELLTVN